MSEVLIGNQDGDPILRGFGRLVEKYVSFTDIDGRDHTQAELRFITNMSYIFDQIAEINKEGEA